MILAAWIGLLLFVLTVERGWAGDLIAYTSLGLSFGVALAEGCRKAMYIRVHYYGFRFALGFVPLLLFLIHLYALTHVNGVQKLTMAIAFMIGFAFWAVRSFVTLCSFAVEEMNTNNSWMSFGGGKVL